ncbi:hypothetical protein X797_011625 [Metarhizium robertsii]|uniref:MEI5 protein n=1 Tax=Metarhizium robertsii TaxID=568076 RepID=A0A014N6F8_9HYPO|nr:hypothetical protein X797_011625 [Metarhizium robertsii]
MPSQTTNNKSQQKTKQVPAATSQDGNKDPVKDLLLMFEGFASSASFLELKTMHIDNTTLRDNLQTSEIAYRKNVGELAQCSVQLQEQKEQLEKERAEKKIMEKELQVKQKQAAQHATDVKHQEEKLQTMIADIKTKDSRILALENIQQERDKIKLELASRKEQLANKTEELAGVQEQLATIESFRVKMQPLDDEKEKICQILDTTFHDAYQFMEDQLDRELDERFLRDNIAWETIRNNPLTLHVTPLCASNSLAARRMRVAAGLAAYGKALDGYIFKPVYMTSQNDEIDQTLNALWTKNASHAFYVRAVLLSVLPETQEKKKNERVNEVVKQVYDAVGSFVNSERKEEFKSKLEDLCNRTCDGWMQIQHLEERVRPSFSPNYINVWKPLPGSSSSRRTETTTSTPSPASSTAASTSQKKPEEGQPRRQEVGKVIWPSFLYQYPEDPDEDLLHHGYVLTDAQTAEAEKEGESSRRLARRNTRNNEQIGTKKRRDSGIFLPKGGSDRSGIA